jgi:hypothetical protein
LHVDLEFRHYFFQQTYSHTKFNGLLQSLLRFFAEINSHALRKENYPLSSPYFKSSSGDKSVGQHSHRRQCRFARGASERQSQLIALRRRNSNFAQLAKRPGQISIFHTFELKQDI